MDEYGYMGEQDSYSLSSNSTGLSEMESLVKVGHTNSANPLKAEEIQRITQEFAAQRIKHELEQIVIKTKIMDTITQKLGKTIDRMAMDDIDDDPRLFNIWIRAQEALLRSMEFSEKLIAPQGGLFASLLSVSNNNASDGTETSLIATTATASGRQAIRDAVQLLTGNLDNF